MGNDVGVVDRTRRRSVTRPTSVVPRLPCSWTAASSERAPDGCDAHAYSCAAPCPSMPAMPPWRVPGCSRKPAYRHTESGRHARHGLGRTARMPHMHAPHVHVHVCTTCMHWTHAPHAHNGLCHAQQPVAMPLCLPPGNTWPHSRQAGVSTAHCDLPHPLHGTLVGQTPTRNLPLPHTAFPCPCAYGI